MIVDLQYFIIMELDELYMVNFMDNSWIYGLSKIVHSVEVWISVAHGYYPYIYIFAYLQLYPSSTDLWLE